MGENSAIEWTTHTFNPWEGCQRVSPGCMHCYAETRNHRWAGDDSSKILWGPKAPRRRTVPSNWFKPLKWNREAAAAGRRDRVFCASLADVFEDREELVPWRLELLDLIRKTPSLDWLLLTKRPENVRPMLTAAAEGLRRKLITETPSPQTPELFALHNWLALWLGVSPPANVWLGTTAEDQQRANERLPVLLEVAAVVHFVSLEPLLERVSLREAMALSLPGRHRHTRHTLDWAIIGGESGPGARPFETDWARGLLEDCEALLIAPFVKQLGAKPQGGWAEFPDEQQAAYDARGMQCFDFEIYPLELKDKAGGEITEWPEDLRVRRFPGGFPS